MAAGHYKLDNLVAIIDRNTLQITGPTEEVIALEPLADKLKSFGFAVHEVNGNDIDELVNLFAQLPFASEKPAAVIARTTKGKGVSFMEDALHWHHKVPDDDQLQAALQELNTARDLVEA
jgi:transketolase